MKHIRKFNESVKEKIPLNDFLSDFTKTKFFIEEEIADSYDEDEWPNNFISVEVLDKDGFEQLTEGEKNFPYELVDIYTENGDGRDETTTTGIFKRKSDGKYFSMWSHDAGFIGPSTLTSSEYLEEVSPSNNNKTIWK